MMAKRCLTFQGRKESVEMENLPVWFRPWGARELAVVVIVISTSPLPQINF